MKKNTMMRIASFLLIAVLLSTSAISGTYAKYVTKATGMDEARVAKFGVVVAVKGNLFAKTYVQKADGNVPGTANLTVESFDEVDGISNLVAPGTQNNKGLTFSITGKPEVKVKVDISINDETRKDVYLVKGDYLDWTTGDDTEDTFNLANNYHPILFTLTNGAGTEVLKDVNILTIEDYLEKTLSKEYDANTNLATELSGNDNGTFTLTWKWNFENGLDEADTLLGNIAAGVDTVTDPKYYNLTTHIDLSITVTQVD